MTKREAEANRPASQAASRPQQAEKDGADSAFDLWLNRGLHHLFDDVAQEPLPEELLRLIEEDRKP